LLRATWHLLAIEDAESGPLRHAYSRDQVLPQPPPHSRSNNTKAGHGGSNHLTNALMEHNLQMLSGEKNPSGSAVAFRWLKMIFLRDEVQTPSIFSYTTSCSCCHACAAFWTNFSWLYRQGDRFIFNHVLCCCHPGATTKTFVIWLQFCTYDLSTHGPSAFCSRLCMFVLLPAQVPTCCVCLANVACWDVHLARPRPPGKELARDMRDHPDF
jgi:hypothetical protein